jgi:hypothetical protein
MATPNHVTLTLVFEDGKIVDVIGVNVEVTPVSYEEREIFSKGRVVETIQAGHIAAACYIRIDGKKVPVPCPC